MAPAYRAGFVEAAEEEEKSPRSDGETLSLETWSSQIVELIMTLVEHPRLSATLANALDDTVYQAIGPVCMTAAQVEAWLDDPSHVIAAPKSSSTPRACPGAPGQLCDRFEGAALGFVVRGDAELGGVGGGAGRPALVEGARGHHAGSVGVVVGDFRPKFRRRTTRS